MIAAVVALKLRQNFGQIAETKVATKFAIVRHRVSASARQHRSSTDALCSDNLAVRHKAVVSWKNEDQLRITNELRMKTEEATNLDSLRGTSYHRWIDIEDAE